MHPSCSSLRTQLSRAPCRGADVSPLPSLLPQDTTIIPLLSSVHMDPTQWENPEEVDPGHFLDEKGNFRKREAFMAFSAGECCCGARVCWG